ncbi:MAG: HD domain-containing protein [Chloroflexi bacterium]|nr:HD domain-containing protein [Chloroflexota bacterium]
MIDPEVAHLYYQENEAAHGFDHVLRVWRLAERIGREEGADLEILKAAALLHDVGRAEELRTGADHAEIGARKAIEILRGHSREKVNAVAQAIREHRFRTAQSPTSLEAKVLFDADKLDSIGAIGIARAYAVAGARGQRLWAKVGEDYVRREPTEGQRDMQADEHTPVHEFSFKLSCLAERLYTPSGRRLAVERHEFMVQFFRRLEQEIEGLL